MKPVLIVVDEASNVPRDTVDKIVEVAKHTNDQVFAVGFPKGANWFYKLYTGAKCTCEWIGLKWNRDLECPLHGGHY